MGKLRNYFLNHYPRTDFHELNQDWMISMLFDMINQVENFVEMNSVKYANPIQWDITRPYEKNTIVIDEITGTAYISSKPVPKGVALSRTKYWNVIFDIGRFITLAAQNFANSYEAVVTTTATMPTDKDKWVVWNSILYRAKNDIHVGDMYVIDGNIEKYTVEMFFDELAHLIAEETEARIEADNDLHGEIVDESVARENADNTLQDNIDAEATARENADNALHDNIDAESVARENADNALHDNIDAEAIARENADNALHDNIDAEAIARENAVSTINNKIVSLTRVINVKDYGAVGDGVTNDYQAIINAIDAIDDEIRTVYFPSGTYAIDGTISLSNTPNITFMGDGNSSIIMALGGDDIYRFNTCNYLTIKDLELNRSVAKSGNGIVFHTGYWSQFVLLSNVHVRNQRRGLYTPDSRLGVSNIDNCTFIGNEYGMVLTMNNDIFITNTNFTNNSEAGLSVGGSTEYPSDGGVWCSNCMAYGNGVGVALNGTQTQHVYNFNWTGGIIDANTSDIASVYMTYVEDCVFNTKVSWGNGDGYRISNCTHIRLRGEINDCNKHGISLYDTCPYIDIDCDISSCGASASGTYDGIYALYATLTYTYIRGLIYNRPDKGTLRNGITLGASCEYVIFNGIMSAVSAYFSDAGNNNHYFNRNLLDGKAILTEA